MNDSFLEKIQQESLKKLNLKELEILCQEIRDFLIKSVSETGGHLASNLGVVELTVALHYVFDIGVDQIIFDVSHQSYIHKLLTGRKDQFSRLRMKDGLSGFTNPAEHLADIAQLGHAGTSLSIASGLSKSYELQGLKDFPFTIAVIGDASISNGVSFEALNNLDQLKPKKLLIIINDNQMSISKTVGSVSQLLAHITTHPLYFQMKKWVKKTSLSRFLFKKIKKKIEVNFFEIFGIRYLGPINGHDLKGLINFFDHLKKKLEMNENYMIVHVITKKGKGEIKIEESPEKYHGMVPIATPSPYKTYTQIFGETIVEMQQKYQNIVAVTAAMTQGTGLTQFAKHFPNHFFDMGIAEEYAVSFASFLNYHHRVKPYIAIYSSFLQRALDQIFQETILQESLNPIFIIDRAGFVGEDGVTHHGLFDIAYLKAFPRAVLMSPKSEEEFKMMLEWAYHQHWPIFIRFPKGVVTSFAFLQEQNSILNLGKAEWLIKNPNSKCVIISYGTLVYEIFEIKDQIPPFDCINLRFAKPLDHQMLFEVIQLNLPVITIEEHSIIGGVGESIATFLLNHRFQNSILNLGCQDQFYFHAKREELLEMSFLKGAPLVDKINKFLNHH